MSPFGFLFYSPYTAYQAYYNYYNNPGYYGGGSSGSASSASSQSWNNNTYYDSNRGYTVAPRGNLGAMSSSPASAVASAPSTSGRGDVGAGAAGGHSTGSTGRGK